MAKLLRIGNSEPKRYVFPVIGNTKVNRIDRTAVLAILTPIWTTKPETARRIRLIIKQTMSWAMAYGHIQINPAGEIIDAALPAMPKVAAHFAALPFPELSQAIKAVDESTAFPSTKLAFKFLVLTACRSAEVPGRKMGRTRPGQRHMDHSRLPDEVG